MTQLADTRSALADTIKKLRTFVPAKDFETSKRFYADLGFQVKLLDQNLADIALGTHSFLLQNFYVPEWAGNFMMHLLVDDLDAWWRHIATSTCPGATASRRRSRRNSRNGA